MTTSSPNLLARFHAMWTLEGLGALKPALVRQLMEDPEPRMRIQAIRASETLYKAGDRSFAADYATLTKDADVDVVIQAMLTINRWKVADADATTKTVMEGNQAKGVQLVGTTMLTAAANANNDRGRGNLSEEERNRLDRGGQIYNELCFACHGPDALGTPTAEPGVTQAPPLAGSSRVNAHRDYIIKVVLNGLVGPLDGKTFPDVMIAMSNNDDEWVAAVTSYVRNSFGNSGGFVTPADVARVRAASAARKTSWTLPELTATLPAPSGHGRLEGDSEPECGRRHRRASSDRMEHRAAAANRPVVPGRAAEGGDGDRDPIPVTGARRARRWRECRGGERRRRAGCRTGRLPARLHGGGLAGWRLVDGRRTRCRQRPDDDQHVHAGLSEVRAHHADRERRRCPGVVSAESQDLLGESLRA